MKGKLLKACMSKMSPNKNNNVVNTHKVSPCTCCDQPCCQWSLWPFKNGITAPTNEDVSIPKDVPKGHLVVYVGQENGCEKRFVIKLGILNHPLFRALLDRTSDEFGYVPGNKLRIDCDESLFLNVVRCASCPDRDALSWLSI